MLHLILRLRGGGYGKILMENTRSGPMQEMTVAAGGSIDQVILRDTFAPGFWDIESVSMFNLQLFDARLFEHALGIKAPGTPIDATTYADHGYPFFKLYEEPSGISGNFPVQSVSELDKLNGTNQSTHLKESTLDFPVVNIGLGDGLKKVSDPSVIKINTVDQKSVFLPIRLLEKTVQEGPEA